MTRPLVPVTWKQAAGRHIKVKKSCTRASTPALKKKKKKKGWNFTPRGQHIKCIRTGGDKYEITYCTALRRRRRLGGRRRRGLTEAELMKNKKPV